MAAKASSWVGEICMNHLCSISDSNYMPKLLALYNSLVATQADPFTLHVVCLDKTTKDFITKKNKQNFHAIDIEDMEMADFQLRYTRYYGTPSQEAISNATSQRKDPRYIQYCWALASYTCSYMLERHSVPSILYLDSDLFFYRNLSGIYEEIGSKSIGIVRHRINYSPSVGEYNVGIVYFKNDPAGRSCCRWWKSVLLDSNNKYAKEYGVCGDQKYLELFAPLFGKDNVCVIDETVGHLAPWNMYSHEYPRNTDKVIVWEGKTQPIYYFHFAHFVYENANSYRSSYRDEWVWGIPENVSTLAKLLYDEYFDAIRKAYTELDRHQ